MYLSSFSIYSAVIVGPPLKVEAVPMKNDTIVTVSWEPIENPIPSIVIISGYAVEYKKSDDSLYIVSNWYIYGI